MSPVLQGVADRRRAKDIVMTKKAHWDLRGQGWGGAAWPDYQMLGMKV